MVENYLKFRIATMKRGWCIDNVRESWEEFEKRVGIKRTGWQMQNM